MSTAITHRRDTAANWTSNNPTLAAGEFGIESDTGLVKLGDGSTAWTSLPYHTSPRRFYGVTGAQTIDGTPAGVRAASFGAPLVQLDPAGTESFAHNVDIPQEWNTADAFLYIVTVDTTASNDVFIYSQLRSAGDGDNVTLAADVDRVNLVAAAVAVTGGTAWIAQRKALGTGLDLSVLRGRLCWWSCQRTGADAADTFAGDIGIMGLELVRAS